MSSQVELELKDPQVDPQGELFFKDMSKQINKRYCPGCRQWVPTGNKYGIYSQSIRGSQRQVVDVDDATVGDCGAEKNN